MLRIRLAFTFLLFAGACFCTAPTMAQDAEYQITFEGRWNPSLPTPGSAHFTQVIGATHNSSTSLFSMGQMATEGVEDVAELGVVDTLEDEIGALIGNGSADTLILGADTFIDPEETDAFTFFANESHSEVSLLTMIAPSPDWFVGIDSLDLRDGAGNWRNEIVLDLLSYDAGTEDGDGFSLNNPATNPQETIQLLDTAEPGNPLAGAGSIARVTFTRLNVVPEPGSFAVLFGCMIFTATRRRR